MKEIAFCIYCNFKKEVNLDGYHPKINDRLCPNCGRHMWYFSFDRDKVCEITEYDECGIHGSYDYIKKLFERTLKIMEDL